MDSNNNEILDAIDFTPENLLNADVYGADDEKIGTVSHVHGMGTASQIIVDVGGFLGLGAKPVMLTTADLTFLRDSNGMVHAATNWTKAEVKALPEHLDAI